MKFNEDVDEIVQNIIDGIGGILVNGITIGIGFLFAFLFVNMFK